MGVAADGLPELGADEHEGVLLVVALLVEGPRAEAVLGGPEKQLRLLYILLFQDSAEYFSLLAFQTENTGVKDNFADSFGVEYFAK